MKILNFGSLNIDYTYKVDHFVRKGETISSMDLQVYSGGKGLNQSIALARAGARVYHAGTIGEDGRFLLDVLKEAGVNTDYVEVRNDVRTGNAVIQNDQYGDNCILLYGGANQAIRQEQVDLVLKNFGVGDYLILQNEISELAYIVERAHEKKMRIVWNPSPINEKVFTIPMEYVDYFVLNEVEAAQLIQTQGDTDESMVCVKELQEQYPEAAVILTLGAEGAVYADKTKRFFQDIYPAKVIDTTAAGDTFLGFLIAGISSGMDIKEAMDLAARAASITITRKGAAPSIPTLQEAYEV